MVSSFKGVASVLVAGRVSIVASVLVDISTHILVGAITVTSDTTIASLLADIVAVLIAFASVATIATTRAVASDTTERTGRLSSVAAIAAVARSGTIGSMGSSVFVTLVEGLEACTALGKADVSRVGAVMLGSTSSVVTNLSVELLNSTGTGCVRKDLSSIASMAAITAIRLSAI